MIAMELRIDLRALTSDKLAFLADLVAGPGSLKESCPELATALIELLAKEADGRALDRASANWTLPLEIFAPDEVLIERWRLAWWWTARCLVHVEKNPELQSLADLLEDLEVQVFNEIASFIDRQDRENLLAAFTQELENLRQV